MKKNGVFKGLAAIPIPAILFVLALGLVTFGAYLMSPFYVTSPVVYIGLPSRWMEIIYGAVLFSLGSLRIIGSVRKNKKLMLFAPFGMMCAYLFLAILRILTVGIIPLTWLPMLLCAVIAGICRVALLYGPEEAKD